MTFGIKVKSENDTVQISEAFKFLEVKSLLPASADISSIPANEIVMATGLIISAFGGSSSVLTPTTGGYAILRPVGVTPMDEDMGLRVWDKDGKLIYDSGIKVVKPVATHTLSYSGTGARYGAVLTLPPVPTKHTRYINFDPFIRVYAMHPSGQSVNIANSLILAARFSSNYQTLELKYFVTQFGPSRSASPAYKVQIVVMDVPN